MLRKRGFFMPRTCFQGFFFDTSEFHVSEFHASSLRGTKPSHELCKHRFNLFSCHGRVFTDFYLLFEHGFCGCFANADFLCHGRVFTDFFSILRNFMCRNFTHRHCEVRSHLMNFANTDLIYFFATDVFSRIFIYCLYTDFADASQTRIFYATDVFSRIFFRYFGISCVGILRIVIARYEAISFFYHLEVKKMKLLVIRFRLLPIAYRLISPLRD